MPARERGGKGRDEGPVQDGNAWGDRNSDRNGSEKSCHRTACGDKKPA